MLRVVLLVVHIGAGTLGLILLVPVIAGAKGTARHVRLGRLFVWCLRLVAASAVGLAVLGIGALWWFIPIAVFSLALGEMGKRAWRRPFAEAVGRHVGGMDGASIAFVTAVLVVNLGIAFVPAWIAPTVIGTVLISRAIARALRYGIPRGGKETGVVSVTT
jgi:hypothetical protein